MGTAIMLRVMPGDQFTIKADAYFDGESEEQGTLEPNELVESLLTTLMGGHTYDGIPLEELPENLQVVEQTIGHPETANTLENIISTNYNPDYPKAHLNILFFDGETMELREEYSKVHQVSGANSGTWAEAYPLDPNITFLEQGYILVYVDNQSIGRPVWFDNIHIEHYNSAVLEESHYYPFGLTLTSSTTGENLQPYKYNGKELEKSFGMETYEYGARQYDPQLGRFQGIDPLADKYQSISPFAYVANNPVKYIDPDGKFILNYTAKQLQEVGLTPAQMKRFEIIANNVSSLVENNPQLMEALVNTTGLKPETIMSELQPGNGPSIEIGEIGGGIVIGGKDRIVFDPSNFKALAAVDGSNIKNLSEQVVGMAFTLLHEYGHHGDQTENDGKNSGQYSVDKGVPIYNEGQSDSKYGTQPWIRSLSGHRGNDITIMGFGVIVLGNGDGSTTIKKGKLSETTPKAYHDKVPGNLPRDAEGALILNKLNILEEWKLK